MRVLYLHQHFATPKGAAGTRSYEMAKALIRRGHEVTMICGANEQSGLQLPPIGRGLRGGTLEGIRVLQVDLPYSNKDGFLKRSLTFLRFALRSLGLVFKERYDLVFATSTPLTAAIPGIAARFFLSKPFVFEVRDLWPELPKAMGVITHPLPLLGMSVLEWAAYQSADELIGLAPGIVEGIRARAPDGKGVAMIPNGCDLELFHPGLRATPEPEGIGPEDCVAIFTGAHGLANGLEAVLDAAAVLKQRGRKDIHLLFVGNGKCKPALVERAKAEGLSNCHFLAPCPKQELGALMARADVGLMILANVPAFYRGTSPNKFFDFLASGLPVLNNYPGWLAGLIKEHRCGLAIKPEQPERFANALEYFADHPKERRRMGKAARKLAEAQFSRESLAQAWVDVLEETMKIHG